MYNNDDIQNMLQIAKANKKQFFAQIDNAKISPYDKLAIESVVNDGWYEAFDKYDSAVCEYFIRIFEEFQKSQKG